jgi:Protein of unknown function (DUF2459)
VLAFGMDFTSRPGHRYAALPFVILLLQACSSMPQHALQARSAAAGSRATIFVARRGWHIDIGFRTLDLQLPLASLSPQLERTQYVFFGFGDRHYLIARNKNFPGLLAALWPGAGVILVTMLAAAPGEAFGNEHVIRLTVSFDEARAAQTFVWDSLLKENDAPVFYRDGPYEGSLFFGAAPEYSAVHTCNTWAAEALRAAGLPVRSRGVVFAWQLWSQTRRIEGTMAALSARVARTPAMAAVRAPRLAHDHAESNAD